jgi:hypothetical protein
VEDFGERVGERLQVAGEGGELGVHRVQRQVGEEAGAGLEGDKAGVEAVERERDVGRLGIDPLQTQLETLKSAQHLRSALLAALQAPELTRADRRRVIDTLKAEIAQAKETLAAQGALGGAVPTLQQVKRGAISVSAALEKGEPNPHVDIFASVTG